MLSPEIIPEFKKQIAFQTEYITDIIRAHDYGLIKLYDPKQQKLTTPDHLMTRYYDFMGATYLHALAIDQVNGDDCIDIHGVTCEVKVARVDSRKMKIGKRGGLIQGTEGNPENSIHARYKVYENTDQSHHTKNTALILLSNDHRCFITGFMLPGEVVERQLHGMEKNVVGRTISLSNFIKYGYEFGSSVPHIGWSDYISTLTDYVRAREGLLTPELTDKIIEKWVGFADPRNLKRL